MSTPFDYETTGGWWCIRCQSYVPWGVDHRHDINAEPELRIATGPAPTVPEYLLPTLTDIKDVLAEILKSLAHFEEMLDKVFEKDAPPPPAKPSPKTYSHDGYVFCATCGTALGTDKEE